MIFLAMFGALLLDGHTAGARPTIYIHIINLFLVSWPTELQEFKKGAMYQAVFVCKEMAS